MHDKRHHHHRAPLTLQLSNGLFQKNILGFINACVWYDGNTSLWDVGDLGSIPTHSKVHMSLAALIGCWNRTTNCYCDPNVLKGLTNLNLPCLKSSELTSSFKVNFLKP